MDHILSGLSTMTHLSWVVLHNTAYSFIELDKAVVHVIRLVIYFCFIDYAKVFDCMDHNKLWKILKEMEIPDHLTCLLRNLYAGQVVV